MTGKNKREYYWNPIGSYLKQRKELTKLEDCIYIFCTNFPKYWYLYRSIHFLASNPRWLAAFYRDLLFKQTTLFEQEFSVEEVLFDNQPGMHARIMNAIMESLERDGVKCTTLQTMRGKWSQRLVATGNEKSNKKFPFFQVIRPVGVESPNLNMFPFWFRPIVRNLIEQTDRQLRHWTEILARSSIRAFITTTPLSVDSGIILQICRSLNIPTIFVQRSLPGEKQWSYQLTDFAILWSPLGRDVLLGLGWDSSTLYVAHNPLLVNPDEFNQRRIQRRKELSIDNKPLLLFLGQLPVDRSFVCEEGYEATCSMAADAFRLLPGEYQILLRPHPMDHSRYTEKLFVARGFSDFAISRGTDLLDDIASCELAMSWWSTAMEEAWLYQKPIIQVLASGYHNPVNFSSLGAKVAGSSEELIQEILRIKSKSESPPEYLQASDVVKQIIGSIS